MKKGKQNLTVYKASAGSGKTFKLVSEYLKLCFASSSPYKFRKILAITFTNKAAGEMKERIIDHLRSLSSEENSKNYDASLINFYQKETGLTKESLKENAGNILTSILHDYTSFSISTIDKFTHKIIRSFARDLKLSADFELEMDPEFVLDKTIDEVLSLAGTDEEITDILTRYVHYLLQEDENWKLENNLKKFSKELLNEGTEEHLNLLKNISPEDFKNIIQKIKQFCTEEESKLKKSCQEIQNIINGNNIEVNDFHYTTTGPYKFVLNISKNEYEKLDLGSRIQKILQDHQIFKKEKQKSFDPGIENSLHSKYTEIAFWIEKSKPKYIAYKLLHQNLYNLSLINTLFEKFKNINREDNVVLIAEFNKIISDVIKNDPAPFIYERIGERYHHILIDEFQDTSELQFTNLVPLIENSLGNGNKCLLVGDPKQAIYRWRGGDVDQFIRLPELKNSNTITQEIFNQNYHVEELKHNYRSGKNIVDFNNQFFHLAASSLDEKYQPIYSTLNQESVKEDGYVELEIIENSATKQENMLSQIMSKINSSLKDGYSYGDICIVTRSNKDGGKIAEYLHSYKIPVFSKESLFLKSSQKVSLIMSFIKYLTYPNDKYAGFKIIELYQNIFISNSTSIHLYDTFKEKYSIFNAKKYLESVGIKYSRNFLLNQNSYQLVDALIKLFFPKSDDVYLKFLSEYVFNQWQKQPMAIHELCQWWEEEGDKLCIQSSNDNEAVILTTIHKSKGLQFPIVIFPYASWIVKNSKNWLWVDLDTNEYPIETFLVKSNSSKLDQTNFSLLKQQEKSKSSLDDLNLLYVAFTRPEERLYILSFDDNYFFKTIKPFLLESLVPVDDHPNFYKKGDIKLKPKQDATTSLTHIINYSNQKNWDERLQLSLTPHKNSDEKNEAYTQKMIGITMHAILEKSKNIDDALLLLQTEKENNPLIKNNIDQIKTELENTFNNEIIQDLNSQFKILNEATIIDKNGKSYRPDKIYLKNNNIIILDYKTGLKNEEHAIQLMEYGELLSQIGFHIEKKYLYYTKQSELLSI